MELKLGSHNKLTSPRYFLQTAEEAIGNKANCLMIFTGPPQNSKRTPVEELRINDGWELLKQFGYTKNDVVVHAPYIINLANPDEEKRTFAVSILTEEVKRSFHLGAKHIVLHPGSAVNKDREQSIKWISQGINQVIKNTQFLDVIISIETMAGKGNEVGITFEEVKKMLDGVEEKSRIGVCIDTCHIYDAGYDIVNNYEKIIKHFDNIIGLEYLKVIHLNDSIHGLYSKKDRHANIGYGKIGFETLSRFCRDERFSNIPIILETPYINEKSPYKYEIENLRNNKFKEIEL